MSLAVRGVLVGLVALVMQWAPIACSLIAALCFDTSLLNPLVDAVVQIVAIFFGIVKLILELVSGALIIWGILRKILLGRIVHPSAGV